MIRTFVAISIPERILQGIESVLARLQELDLDARFSRVTSIHLTLKFLGNIDESLLDGVSEALARSAKTADLFSLAVEGGGVFPNLKRPRVIWIGFGEEPILVDLQREVEANFECLGFEVEKRPFNPHLTLARLKSSKNLSKLERFLASEGENIKIGSFEVDSIHLYQSILRPEGAEYRRLVTHSLGKESEMGS